MARARDPRRPGRSTFAASLWRIGSLIVLLIGLGAGLWWTAAVSPSAEQRPSASPPERVAVRVTPGVGRSMASVVPKPGDRPTPGTSRAVIPSGAAPAGRVAIIFDDAGATLDQLQPILTLDRPVAVAVLPGLSASRAVAERATRAGLEVLLHLPLEPEETENARPLGPGGVTTTMTDEEIAAVVRRGLEELPGVVGVNSHMGSKATADRRVMTVILSETRARGLFFVDSRTTPRTIGLAVARDLGVPAMERTVFLDNEDDPGYIFGQLRRLLQAARLHGQAVGIGHAQKTTAEVLRQFLPEFDRAGIVLVPVSALMHSR